MFARKVRFKPAVRAAEQPAFEPCIEPCSYHPVHARCSNAWREKTQQGFITNKQKKQHLITFFFLNHYYLKPGHGHACGTAIITLSTRGQRSLMCAITRHFAFICFWEGKTQVQAYSMSGSLIVFFQTGIFNSRYWILDHKHHLKSNLHHNPWELKDN